MPEYDAERDLHIVEAMAAQVGQYLVEDQLFWPISGRIRGGMPHLTLGGLLLRLHRLTVLRGLLNPGDQAVLDTALAALQQARQEWSVHFGNKVVQEMDARFGLLRDFLRDCEDASGECVDYWPNRAEHRTILHHLAEEASARGDLTDAARAALSGIDRGLRRFLAPGGAGDFLWADDLKPAYPRDVYWWLWVAPPTEDQLEGRSGK